MARLFTITNPHNPQDGLECVTVPDGVTLAEVGSDYVDGPWLCMAFLDGERFFPLREEWGDVVLGERDMVYMIPRAGLTGLVIITLLVSVAAIAIALSIEVPKPGDTPEPDPVFDLRGEKNAVRLNAPIEDVYGRCRVWPSVAAPAYNQYFGNDQYLYQLLCVGQGSYDVEQILIEDTDISNFQETTYELVPPGSNVTLFPDNVDTSSEVGVIELYGPNEPEYQGESGPFATNGVATTANRLEVDVVLPQGLYYGNDDGELDPRTVTADFEYRQIDDAGVPVGAGTWSTLVSFSKTLNTNTPQRYTFAVDVPPARYEVRAVRTNNKDTSHRAGNVIQWVGLRAFLPSTQDYGDVTLIAVRARASNNLNDSAANRINLVVTRKLPIYDGTSIPNVDDFASRVATRNPVWAFVQIFRAAYGGGLENLYLDLDHLLTEANAAAAQAANFDWVFERRSTVWEAAKTAAFVAKAIPILNGSRVTWIRDFETTIPTFFISPENTVKGSFRLQKKLFQLTEFDGLEVEYRDETTWKSETVLCTLDGQQGINPQKVQYRGVQSRQRAFELGMYQLARTVYERQIVSVKTGLEGYVPTYGDLVRIGSDIPRWGEAGIVVGIDGQTFTLSENVTFAEDETHQIALRGKHGQDVGPYTVTPGPLPNQVVVDGAYPGDQFFFTKDKEPPMFLFGVASFVGRVCRIIDINPDGKSVSIRAVVNDNRRFADPGDAPPLGTGGSTGAPANPVVAGVVVNPVPGSTSLVFVVWTPAVGAQSYVLEQSSNGVDWASVGTFTTTSYPLNIVPGTLYVRVAGVNVGQGPWATWTGEVGAPTGPPFDVSNLMISPAFVGPTLRVQWSTAALAVSYAVRVLTDIGDGAGLVERITTEVEPTEYELSWEDLDAASGLARDITIEVRGKNSLGESDNAATVLAQNAIPPQITDGLTSSLLSETSEVQTYAVAWGQVLANDLKFYRVWASTTSGFTPDASKVVFEGLAAGTTIQVGSTSPGVFPTFYWRVAAVDVWGDETNSSAQQIASASDPGTVTLTPPPGTYGTFPVNVTITKSVAASVIRWSKTGTPDYDDNPYTTPVAMASGETLYARTFASPVLGGPVESGIYASSGSVSAKSVVFDIADFHGSTTWTSLRSVEFKLSGVLIALTAADFTAYATDEFNATVHAENAFDTTLSKTGGATNTNWQQRTGNAQRLIVVFNTSQEFDEIVVNNGHDLGNNTNRGVNNVKITWSSDSITDTTYNAAVSNGTELNNTAWTEHVASDVVDDQTVWTA